MEIRTIDAFFVTTIKVLLINSNSYVHKLLYFVSLSVAPETY